jgi:hypothetical protein
MLKKCKNKGKIGGKGLHSLYFLVQMSCLIGISSLQANKKVADIKQRRTCLLPYQLNVGNQEIRGVI